MDDCSPIVIDWRSAVGGESYLGIGIRHRQRTLSSLKLQESIAKDLHSDRYARSAYIAVFNVPANKSSSKMLGPHARRSFIIMF